jgi:uncharacterized protein YacL
MKYLEIIQIILLLIILFAISKKMPEPVQSVNKKTANRKLIMDSSGLIDGRIIDIVRDSFLSDDIIIAQFIVNELQLLADGHDSHKRERARFGLDMVHELQELDGTNTIIDRSEFPDIKATDDKLVALAKKIDGLLYTTDYNLSKVALVEGVRVLNVNELAQHLRPVALPGETVTVKIVQKGSSANQGVGYLDDGTMIVVDGAARLNGKKVNATVDRMHQTVAGKMVFAKLVNNNPHPTTKN